MPSIAQAPPSPLLNARKRRRDFDEFGLGADAGMEVQMKLTVRYAFSLASLAVSQHS